jgi:hypothetical protein
MKQKKANAKGKAKVKAMKLKLAATASAEKEMPQQKPAATKAKVAATKKNAKATAKAKAKAAAAKTMKKPAAWDKWAEEGEEEEEDADDDMEDQDEEGEDKKNHSPVSRQQAYVFERALKLPPGTNGSLPQEIHDFWNSITRGPGSAQQRHALRNEIVPKNAHYGTVVNIDPNGKKMQKIRSAFEIKQKRVQMKGMCETEMLWGTFQGNKEAMKNAISTGEIKVKDNDQGMPMYYWVREHHEHIKGGSDSFTWGKGEDHAMTNEDLQKLVEMCDWAPWAQWCTTPNSDPQMRAQLKNAATPNSEAIKKAQEGLDASKQLCQQVQNFYKQVKSEGILSRADAGSIPKLMTDAMRKLRELETHHVQTITAIVYDDECTNTQTVKDVKEVLHEAAKTVKQLRTLFEEAKALVTKYKIAAKKKEKNT